MVWVAQSPQEQERAAQAEPLRRQGSGKADRRICSARLRLLLHRARRGSAGGSVAAAAAAPQGAAARHCRSRSRRVTAGVRSSGSGRAATVAAAPSLGTAASRCRIRCSFVGHRGSALTVAAAAATFWGRDTSCGVALKPRRRSLGGGCHSVDPCCCGRAETAAMPPPLVAAPATSSAALCVGAEGAHTRYGPRAGGRQAAGAEEAAALGGAGRRIRRRRGSGGFARSASVGADAGSDGS